ncbi:hypothetical protein [Pseudoroseomonas cervicalis]|uniref:hypothetical protein n=1 Tax=Teichococcus cervicalis TaxID=204525 RepID=UPI0022F1D178|nr:hypothetical protein [Pseudoroseomonas cervicalis]WBV41396.1 hypothetical protein PFY06_09005 [Pseudoroseomonas cervicalis]
MPHRLTAKAQSFVKSDGTTPSRELAESDKRAVRPGDVLETEALRPAGTHLVLGAARLNGEALPGHLTHVFAGHWQVEEIAAAPAAPAPAGAADPKAQVLALLAEGRSVNFIAKSLRIGRAQIKRWRDGA